jgi:hypothetical protein
MHDSPAALHNLAEDSLSPFAQIGFLAGDSVGDQSGESLGKHLDGLP